MTAIVGFVVNNLHYAVAIFAVGGVVLYAFIEKQLAAESGPFVAIRWGINGGSIPICIAYILVAFAPEAWAALQNYHLLATVYGAYHLVKTAQATMPTLRAYINSKSGKQ